MIGFTEIGECLKIHMEANLNEQNNAGGMDSHIRFQATYRPVITKILCNKENPDAKPDINQ